MRVITIWQPWASLIFADRKQFETRPRAFPASLQGQTIAIHSAVKRVPPQVIGETVHAICVEAFGADYAANLPHGCILGTVRLDEALETALHDIHQTAEERAVGNWSEGRWAWKLGAITPLPKPVPARGQQGWWSYEFGSET